MLEVDLWEQCCHSVTWERLFTSLLLKGPRPGPQVSAFFLAPIAACLTWKSALPAGTSHAVPGISKWFQWFQVSGGFDTPFLIFFWAMLWMPVTCYFWTSLLCVVTIRHSFECCRSKPGSKGSSNRVCHCFLSTRCS